MNKFEILSYITIFIFGVSLSASGFFFNDWQYWVLLILTIIYGVTNKLDALQKDGE